MAELSGEGWRVRDPISGRARCGWQRGSDDDPCAKAPGHTDPHRVYSPYGDGRWSEYVAGWPVGEGEPLGRGGGWSQSDRHECGLYGDHRCPSTRISMWGEAVQLHEHEAGDAIDGGGDCVLIEGRLCIRRDGTTDWLILRDRGEPTVRKDRFEQMSTCRHVVHLPPAVDPNASTVRSVEADAIAAGHDTYAEHCRFHVPGTPAHGGGRCGKCDSEPVCGDDRGPGVRCNLAASHGGDHRFEDSSGKGVSWPQRHRTRGCPRCGSDTCPGREADQLPTAVLRCTTLTDGEDAMQEAARLLLEALDDDEDRPRPYAELSDAVLANLGQSPMDAYELADRVAVALWDLGYRRLPEGE